MRPWTVLAWTAIWLMCPVALAQETRIEIYRPQHRLAEELAPVARAIVKDTGSVTADARTNSLILVAPGARMDLVLQVLARQDVAPRTVLVEYRSLRQEELESAGVEFLWSGDARGVRVGHAVRPAAGDPAALALHAAWEQRQQDFTGMLRLLEATSGRILTGTVLPLETPVGAARAATWSGFDVTPRILADGRVRLELAPLHAIQGPGGIVHSTGAGSTVDVVPGELVVLAVVEEGSTGSAAGTSGARRGARRDREVLVVRVRVEGPAGTR